jgi:hypothetical protein
VDGVAAWCGDRTTANTPLNATPHYTASAREYPQTKRFLSLKDAWGALSQALPRGQQGGWPWICGMALELASENIRARWPEIPPMLARFPPGPDTPEMGQKFIDTIPRARLTQPSRPMPSSPRVGQKSPAARPDGGFVFGNERVDRGQSPTSQLPKCGTWKRVYSGRSWCCCAIIAMSDHPKETRHVNT